MSQRDRFLLDLGIPDTGELAPDLAPEHRAHVLANFVAFLRSGGVWSWSDWATMSSATCEIASEAGTIVRGESMAAQAELIALALGTRVGLPSAPLTDAGSREASVSDPVRSALIEVVDRVAVATAGAAP